MLCPPCLLTTTRVARNPSFVLLCSVFMSASSAASGTPDSSLACSQSCSAAFEHMVALPRVLRLRWYKDPTNRNRPFFKISLRTYFEECLSEKLLRKAANMSVDAPQRFETMFSTLRDAFGAMDYQPHARVVEDKKKDTENVFDKGYKSPVQGDGSLHKNMVQVFAFNSWRGNENSIGNATQVPRLMGALRCRRPCVELPRVLGSCARAGCARELRGLPRGANAPTSAATLQASALGIFQA